jgi:hypothetical protein
MPTSLPPRESPPAALLLETVRAVIGAGFFLVAFVLLRARLGPIAHAVARIGKRIGG